MLWHVFSTLVRFGCLGATESKMSQSQPAKSTRGRSKARQKFRPLTTPNPKPGSEDRAGWLKSVCEGFVQPSKANKAYYRVILETLWPKGHGIPGPHVSEPQIRAAINKYRQDKGATEKTVEPYNDPFRRVRELIGEEGLTGIGRQGKSYQLVELTLGPKRKPRIGLSDAAWKIVVERHRGRCPVCGRSEPEVKFDQDHKIPRLRSDIPGGGDQLENWQPLCVECNNAKSMACRGCTFDCRRCGWAFPDKFAPLRVASENLTAIRELAALRRVDPHTLINELLALALAAVAA